jgi:probable rRNA maturation factor
MITVTLQAFLNHPVSQVWETLANQSAWRSDLAETEIVDERTFVERGIDGSETTCLITARVPYTQYAIHRQSAQGSGNWAFECKESAAGTILTVACSVDKKGLAAFGAKAALKKQLRTLIRDLERFFAVSAAHNIIVDSEVEAEEEMEALIRRSITTALAVEGMNLPCEINVLLTDDEGIHRTNLEMRNVDRPTDVLSFPMFDLVPPEKPGEDCVDIASNLVPLGDMCISLERAAAQAEEFGHSVEREVSYLTVHSVLHLLGYDHMDEGEEKARMRAREDAIMNVLGIGR